MNDYMKFGRLMQLAPDGGGGAPTEAPPAEPASNEPEEGAPTEPKEKTFTQADVDAIIGKKYAKWQQEKETAISAAKTEAERLALMSAEERAKHEREAREKKLSERETEIARRELRAQAMETLAEKSLPRELAELLNYADADKCSASITTLETTFRAAVQAGVEERLKGKTPSAGGEPAKTDYKKDIEAAVKAGDHLRVAHLTRLDAEQQQKR